MPVGGVKEKVLAAHRSGIKTVILPRLNQADLDEIPEEVRNQLEFRFIETVDEALQAALEELPSKTEQTHQEAPSDASQDIPD